VLQDRKQKQETKPSKEANCMTAERQWRKQFEPPLCSAVIQFAPFDVYVFLFLLHVWRCLMGEGGGRGLAPINHFGNGEPLLVLMCL